MTAYYVSFIVCVCLTAAQVCKMLYTAIFYIYILYAHWAESQRKCTFPKMCANIRTDYNVLSGHISERVTI